MMTRAGEKEISYLEKLKAGDPENKKHCILYYGKFQHQGHLCMVFEAMHQNLRQALKQHGHRRGIQIDAVSGTSTHVPAFCAVLHVCCH